MKHRLAFLLLLLQTALWAQKPLSQIEKELKPIAFQILNHDSFEYKVALNKQFASVFMDALKRPESYNYAFDSLKTLSILQADDKSFRIFTWYIVKQNFKERYGKQEHFYFGFIQRNKPNPKNPKELIVIPLIEGTEAVQRIENEELTSDNWFGALYYPMKMQPTLPSFTFTYREKPKSSKDKPKKSKRKAYVLLGWNGGDQTCNYKLVDLVSFDDKRDPFTAYFGANVIFYDRIPKLRAVFKYSEYAPFGLNTAKVKYGGFLGLFPKQMIVYDHLASPLKAKELKEIWDLGPDGSYDALEINRMKGYIGWFRNVELSEESGPVMTKAKMRKIQAAKEKTAKDLYGKDYKKYLEQDDLDKKELTAKELKKKQEEEERKQREAGIKKAKMDKKQK